MRVYLSHFKLVCRPFDLTPDPRFLFFTAQHREAYESLLYGIHERKGFMALVGEVGSGKTTLCRAVLSVLGDHVATALVLNPALDGLGLLRAILRDFGLACDSHDRLELLETLNGYLLEQAGRSRNVALFIDEAQNLSASVMEEIRLLSNLETDRHKLLQLVLAGQPELDERLAMPELRQLRQRIAVRCELGSLTLLETDAYLDYRLIAAGAGDDLFFEDEAIRLLHHGSRGIPRLMNKVADRSLLAAYARGRHAVGERDVRRALRELRSVL